MEQFFNSKYQKYRCTRVFNLQDDEGKIFREGVICNEIQFKNDKKRYINYLKLVSKMTQYIM